MGGFPFRNGDTGDRHSEVFEVTAKSSSSSPPVSSKPRARPDYSAGRASGFVEKAGRLVPYTNIIGMLTKRLTKIGNSTGLVIDRPLLDLLGLDRGDEVQLRIEKGAAPRPGCQLDPCAAEGPGGVLGRRAAVPISNGSYRTSSMTPSSRTVKTPSASSPLSIWPIAAKRLPPMRER